MILDTQYKGDIKDDDDDDDDDDDNKHVPKSVETSQ
jgi:hypothetical protein